jgi:hypothetical protein
MQLLRRANGGFHSRTKRAKVCANDPGAPKGKKHSRIAALMPFSHFRATVTAPRARICTLNLSECQNAYDANPHMPHLPVLRRSFQRMPPPRAILIAEHGFCPLRGSVQPPGNH